MTKNNGHITWITEKRKISELTFAPYNPRELTETQAKDLSTSLERFNLADPIVINSNNRIIGGHQRINILKQSGDLTVDVRVPSRELTEHEEKELNLRLNKNLGQWDLDALANFNEEMLKDVGFDSKELDKIFQLDTTPEDDDVPEIRTTDIKTGDLFQLGEHRLLCGDSTQKADVERLMAGEKADMVFTSPPYWVGFEYENENDKESILAHISQSAYLMSLFTIGKIVINTGNINSITTAEKITGKKQPALLIDWWIDALNKNNYLLRHIRIWAKMGGVMPSRRNDKIDMYWEYLATFTKESGNAGFIATFKNANDNFGQVLGTPEWAVKGVWTDIQGKAREAGHCAGFPVELPIRYLMMYTDRGMLIYEPYGGSGSTLIACEKLNRKCRMMEIDQIYCQVIIDRWEKFTNGKAVKIG